MEKLNAEVFLKVVETGSFKKAADILNYTQAGVSYIINAMEEEYGIKLFYREHGGVRLNENGKELLPLIRQLDRDEHFIREKINAIKGLSSGTVRVSTFNSVYIRWLPGILRSFEEKYPGIKVEVVSCEDNTENERLIFSRDVDCGFLVGKPSLEIESFDLVDDALMAAVSPDHPFAGRETFPLDELPSQPYIMISFDKSDFYDLLFRNGTGPNTKYIADNEFAAMAMVSQGLGVSVFSRLLLRDPVFPVCALPFDPPVIRTLGIGTRSMKTCTAATKEFIRCTENWIRRNDASFSC